MELDTEAWLAASIEVFEHLPPYPWTEELLQAGHPIWVIPRKGAFVVAPEP
jgi:hypothetical protein